MKGSNTGTPVSARNKTNTRSAFSMPAGNGPPTDPEALQPTSSGGGRDHDEKIALIHRAGSKNLRAAVTQAPKEVRTVTLLLLRGDA
jgi:hypothetical protein